MRRALLALLIVQSCIDIVSAQSVAERRQAILQAEERGAPTSKDLSTITSGLRSDAETSRIAVRALGRLERPSLISSILPLLQSQSPDVRAEAANALAQAAQGFNQPKVSASATIGSTEAALIARLGVETEAQVRAALGEAVARLPYRTAADVERAERAILATATRGHAVPDRLGVAKALEALVRLQLSLRPPGGDAIEQLKTLAFGPAAEPDLDPLRDARVRRLALEALITANALDDTIVTRARKDPDPQVRRLAARAAAASGRGIAVIEEGLHDPVAMVRIESLHAVRAQGHDASCSAATTAAVDWATEVAVVALDALATCHSELSIAVLERAAADPTSTNGTRTWPRAARALVALASAAPERTAAPLSTATSASQWQLRFYAARAARILKDRVVLSRLAADGHPAVAAEASTALDGSPRRSQTSSDDFNRNAQGAAPDPRRLAGLRARVTIRDLGSFDIALITIEAQTTALRFAQQAAAGLYTGRMFRTTPTGAFVDSGSRPFAVSPASTRPETGLWPNVRGSLGVSADGHDGGDALFFINLVDNPRFDHQHTVFGQVLNGLDVIDQIVDADVIESVEVLP